MFNKITEQEIQAVYVKSAPDRLSGTADENKNVFDKYPELIREKYNGLVDDLMNVEDGMSGADNIGATPLSEGKPSTVQGQLDDLYGNKVEKEDGKGLSGNDFTDELKEEYDDAALKRHTHGNKGVLDQILQTVKEGYDRLVALFSGIDSIAKTLEFSDNSVPTSKAVSEAISQAGGGDMMRSTYDVDGNGVVDDSEMLGGKLPSYYVGHEELELTYATKEELEGIAETYVVSVSDVWIGSGAPYTQTIAVVGMLATDNPFFDVVVPEGYDNAQAAIVEYSKIYDMVTENGSIILYAVEPAAELMLQLKVVR